MTTIMQPTPNPTEHSSRSDSLPISPTTPSEYMQRTIEPISSERTIQNQVDGFVKVYSSNELGLEDTPPLKSNENSFSTNSSAYIGPLEQNEPFDTTERDALAAKKTLKMKRMYEYTIYLIIGVGLGVMLRFVGFINF